PVGVDLDGIDSIENPFLQSYARLCGAYRSRARLSQILCQLYRAPAVIMSNSWIRARLSRLTTWLVICGLFLAAAAALALSGHLESCALMLIATIGAGLLWARRHVDHQKSVDVHFKALVDQSTDGIVIADPESQAVLYANPAFSASLGYSEAE